MYAVTLRELVALHLIYACPFMCTVCICLVFETNVIGIYITNNELFEFTIMHIFKH